DDPLSVLKVYIADYSASSTTIRWPSAAQRIYEVEARSNNYNQAWLSISNNIPATPPTNLFTLPIMNVQSEFIRVNVRRP
ncbi:MAG: hypothetical protein AAF492_31135, partial [Verrucomicrobiota bacterium]